MADEVERGCPACGRDVPLRKLVTKHWDGRETRQSACVECAVGLAFEAGRAHAYAVMLEEPCDER